MAIIVRMDIDRPFGKKSFIYQALSRVGSDLYFPRLHSLRYLSDLQEVLPILESYNARSYVFFRRCTFPTTSVLQALKRGGHIVGLHLENSRSLDSFKKELERLRSYTNEEVSTFSKHGSGTHRYGLFHHAPYEPDKYVIWAKELGMKAFFGNGEDPTVQSFRDGSLRVFPSAFWLEPFWRNTARFTVDWLREQSTQRDIVLLFHPDNVTAVKGLMDCLIRILQECNTRVL